MSALVWSRFQFAFTITFHYLFPQLTMGLALLLVVFKLRGQDVAARFWAKIFAVNFVVGVVTGIPMEFQFGTNWARFSALSGGVIGLSLAMEGMFAFFAESAFLGLFLYGEKRLGRRGHTAAAIMVWLGSWLSGYFIVVTNAFMQHPAGYAVGADGALHMSQAGTYLFQPWAIVEYAHTMCAAVITGSFVVAAVSAYWLLRGQAIDVAKGCLRVAVIAGLASSIVILFPTGDAQGKLVARHQPAALAAMEGKFETGTRAELVLIGQPDVEHRALENPVIVPGILSYLAYGSFGAEVKGLDAFPREDRPDTVELLYFAYHVMAGLGTLMIAVMLVSALLLRRGRLYRSRAMQWVLLLAFPFPYIATTFGWMTAELGRQPWLVYGIQRTAAGTSPQVPAGDVTFSALGFMGAYLVLGLLFVTFVLRQIGRGP